MEPALLGGLYITLLSVVLIRADSLPVVLAMGPGGILRQGKRKESPSLSFKMVGLVGNFINYMLRMLRLSLNWPIIPF